MEAILIEYVQNSLRHFMYRNAIFMCERLCAEFPSETNLQLLAGCYLHNNQAYSAYHILKGTQMAQSRYLFALSCFQMDLLNEAETALSPVNESSAEVPNGAYGHYLLGLIYRYTDRRQSAVRHFKQALSIDPLLWAAYEELCILGAAEEATAVFSEAAAVCIQKQHVRHVPASQNLLTFSEDQDLVSVRSVVSEDFSLRQKHMQNNNLKDMPGSYNGPNMSGGAAGQPINGGSSNMSFCSTPSPMAAQLSGVAPPPPCRNVQQNGPYPSSADSSPRSTVNPVIQPHRRKVVDEGKFRKISGRLFPDSGYNFRKRPGAESGTNTNTSTTTVAGNGTSHSSKHIETIPKGQSRNNQRTRPDFFDDSRSNSTTTTSTSSPSGITRSLDLEGATMPINGALMNNSRLLLGASEILGLLRILGEGYRLFCVYRCQDAVDIFLKLPHKHYNTGWVLSQVGKAYFELVDFLEADRAFSLARRASPYSLDGMDIYSTVLYHLKEDMKLSYLAQELISTDRLAPQSWCAMGNCYSLQKDHETALKNFQRAVQLNSRYAYARTLCGHEYVALEDYENGTRSYQSALRIDARHYNAWYGLGMVYLRQEKFEFAEHHFRMAFQINSHSSIIMCYLGTALHALSRSEEALEVMEKAILADKKNPLPMYQKANILMNMGCFDEALDVLEELKEYAPRESSVYALMGKIYKRRNMHEKAMLNYGLALDLKPSATDVATIKAAIEKLHVPDEIEEHV